MITPLSSWCSHPSKRFLFVLFAFLLPATLMRAALFLIYRDDFADLGLVQMLAAFVFGLRFDLSMAVTLAGLPVLLMWLPFRWSHHRSWQWFWGGLIFFGWLFFLVLMVIDTIYFGIVHRHVGSEINTIANDMESLIDLAFSQYRSVLVSFILFALPAAWLWWRMLSPLPAPPARLWPRLLMFPLLFLLLLIAGRGGYTGKPISVADAFFTGSLAQGYLTMNGAFAMTRAWDEPLPTIKTFMPQAEADALVQNHLKNPGQNFPLAQYPLYRAAPAAANKSKPNVVVLMLESWGAAHIDALRRVSHLPPLGATPNFDQLAARGRLFTRFYANGQRSIQGTAAILAGQPTFPGMPVIGLGMEQNRLSFLGQLATAEGYSTFMLQSSVRRSLHFDALAPRAGFTTYLGDEDIANVHEHPKPDSTWGTWDHNTLQQANQLFAAANKPFLGFVFTSTTHTPWIVPDARWHKFSGGKDKDAFQNSLLYADWALGELIASAKKAGYYDNTIFVITADHADGFFEHPEHIPNQYHIPLLIAGPGVVAGMDDTVGSQFDIVPTLMELCGWNQPYAGLGRSLLDTSNPEQRAALAIRGDVMDWITPQGWVSHNLDRRVGQSQDLSAAQADVMEKALMAAYQTTIQLQINNRILPPTK